MKKTLLALAITAMSANAFAADVDYFTAPGTPVVNTIAKEVVTVATATALTTGDTVSWPLGFSITDQNLVRVDLSNGATFTAAPSLAANTAGVPVTSSIAQGGVGQSFVVFQFAPGATAAFDKDAALTLAGLTVANQGNVDVRYRLYSSQPDAATANANTLVDKTYAYAKFDNGLVFAAANPGVSRQIDVAQASKYFDGATNDILSTAFGGLNLSVASVATYGTDLGTALDLTDMVGTNATVTVTGDFSAISGTPANTLLAALTGTGVNATETAVTFNLGGVTATPLTAAALTYQVDGTTVIAPSEFNAKLTLGAGALVAAAPAEVNNFATLAKNGSTQYVDLALNPNGAFKNLVRISNKSNTAGNVYLTVIADDGSQAQISLGEIEGQTSSVLGARSSTTQIDVKQIFAAAAAKGLVLAGENKLRLVVDGEFKGGSAENALSNDYALSVQSLTVATNGTSFSSF